MNIQKLLEWIVNVGIQGFGVLPPAEKVAEDHLSNCGNDCEKAINSIISWRTTYAATAELVTGLGGLFTLPVSIPSCLFCLILCFGGKYISGYSLSQRI